jgi:ribokinase
MLNQPAPREQRFLAPRARPGAEVRLVGYVGDDDLAVQALAGPRADGVETTSPARAARDAGMLVVLDPAPPERVPDTLLGLVDHLTPDHREAEALTGIDARSRDGARRAAEALRARGVAAVSVKLDGGGCVVACNGGLETIEAPEVRAVDTTGAGDAFAGALAWAVASGCGQAEAAAWGVTASAYAVQTYGSQAAYPTLDELTRLRATVDAPSPP